MNQDLKRGRLPSGEILAAAEAKVDRWEAAWLTDEALGTRFQQDSAAVLPVRVNADVSELFDGFLWRRLLLRQDLQVPEWVRRLETAREGMEV